MLSSRRHPDDRALVSRLDHELPAAHAAAVDAHLAACERCRARADALLAAERSVRLGLRSRSDGDHHARRRASLADALEQEAIRRRPAKLALRRMIAPVAAGALAAGLAMILASVSRNAASGPEDAAALPIARLTPGATAPLTTAELCSGVQPSRAVPAVVT